MEGERKADSGKITLVVVVAVVLAVTLFNEEFNAAARSLLILGGKLVAALLLCVLVYQGYDGIRSGLTGTQPTTAKEVDDPTSGSDRFAGLALGLTYWAIAFFGAAWLLDWDWPFRLLFGKLD